MTGKMKNAVQIFRRSMKSSADDRLTDNYYILVRAAQSAVRECKAAKRKIRGSDFIDSLVESCIRLCKNGRLPAEEEIIAYFGAKASSLTAEYLPLCLTCALVELAARGVRANDEKGGEMLLEAVKSLRRMGETDFELISASLSETESILREDAEYPLTDERSRAYYRACVARKSRKTKIHEAEIAREALEKSQKTSAHVGEYIVPKGKSKKRGITMLVMQLIMPLATCAAAGILLGSAVFSLLTFVPLYSVFRSLIEGAILKGVAPERLLRLKPTDKRVQKTGVLITVSTLMPLPEKAVAFGKHLEKLYLSNKTEGVRVCCLADFKGAPSPVMPEDKTAVKALCEVIDKLNRKHSGGFILALRPRVFSKTQGEFTGRERKRGAITDLAQALRGSEKGFGMIYGDKAELKKTKYILALDADSLPQFDCAAELVAIAEHPLNRPVINKKLGRVTRGYGIIVPKSENRIDCENPTVFERIMAGSGGSGVYDTIAGEKYRDLFGESIFCGKGLIDVDTYNALMTSGLPKERILSHDIIESGYLRAALAGDVTVSDGFPKSAESWFARLHRWIRGDWQNIGFVFGKNPLNLLSRYKLFDNILRSLIKPFCVFTVAASLFVGGRIGLLAAAVAVFALCADDLFAGVQSVLGGGFSSVSRLYYSETVPNSVACFVRAFVSLSFSVHESVVSLDAAAKALVRLASKKNLLEWVPAAGGGIRNSAVQKILFCLPSVAASAALFVFGSPFYRLLALILLCDLPLTLFTAVKRSPKEQKLSSLNRERLLGYAGATWRFFDELCGKENNFLPPDNIQLSPVSVTAKRTSPTNIGLMLLSFLAARDLGFITSQELFLRLEMSLKTVEKLEKYKGNLLNWYSTEDCVALEPRFVSTVDSGNFLCCLTALKEGLGEYAAECPSLCGTASEIEKLIADTDLSDLYNRRRKLFHIGLYPETGEKSESFYDLFMSESRMTSYFAVAKRIVPKSHWSATGRIYVSRGRRCGLVSWTGTMFEYFMPSLFMPSPKGSVSYESLRFCLQCQRKRAGKRPFGISESGFYAFDGNLNYQYKAHGVGKLGLSRGLDAETVVSPYSSFLSLEASPNVSVRNLARLEKLGMLGKYGFFEAADYTESRVREDFAIIRSFMAHHQGMSLVAAVNALQNNRMQRRFMRDSSMKGAESLLYERTDTEEKVFKDIRRRETPKIRDRVSGSSRFYKNPSPLSPHAAVYSNGRLAVCITDCGSGHTLINGVDATVRSEDILARPQGVFAVFTNEDLRISVTRVLGDGADYSAEFGQKYALHTAEYKNIRMTMKTSVISNLNCEVRAFTVENNSKTELKGKLTVYFEPCLDSYADFSAHPAYSKLFLKDKWDGENGCCVFTRNAVGGESPAVVAGFIENSGVRCFTSKENVLTTPSGVFSLGMRKYLRQGRGNPDCCCCFEIDISLKSGEKCKKTLLIAADDSKEAAENTFLTVKNGSGKVRLSQGLFSGENLDSAVAAAVLPSVIYPKSLTKEQKSVGFALEDLWSFGISGDYPIILVEAEKEEDIRKLLPYIRVNKELRSCGIRTDLVVTHSIDEGYNTNFSRALRKLLSEENCELMFGIKSGVHSVNLRGVSPARKAALQGFASFSANLKNFVLDDGKKQYKPLKLIAENENKSETKNSASVKQYNFTEGKIGVKNRGKTVDIPWNMVFANKSFGTMVSDKALGFTWAINSRENKLTPWYNDTSTDNRGEMLIWKNNGILYDIIAVSKAVFMPEKAVWKSEINGVDFTVTLTVPERGMTKKISVEICNKSGQVKDGELMYYTLPVLGAARNIRTACRVDKTEKGAVVSNVSSSVTGFMAVECNEKADFICFSRPDFFEGRFNSDFELPQDCCVATGRRISLAAGGKTQTVFNLSWAASEKAAVLMSSAADFRKKQLNPLHLSSENEKLNLFFNSFLYSQVKQSRFYARTGFWQCSGAYGFRDQLQDSLGFLFAEPEITRTHLLRCAAVQFLEGDVLHWWHVTVKKHQVIRGIRTKCSDDMLWLPFVCAEYVRNTGDCGILNVEIPYLESQKLLRNEKERYISPVRSKIKGSLLEHCIKAVEKGCNFGKNGLPLIGSCDWNDAFSNLGSDTDGESVWLAMFLIIVLEKMAALCESVGITQKAADFSKTASNLRETVEKTAWAGDRYARAILKNGEKLGANGEFIDILPQAFAVFAGLENAKTAVETAYSKLVDSQNRVIRLLSPPFSPDSRSDIGYIAAYPKGIRENGGQYTHAAVWLAMALFNLGENEKASELVDLINPLGFYDTQSLSEKYRAEPFVLAGDVSYADGITSRAGWTHFTGSAAWFYRCIAENYAENLSAGVSAAEISETGKCKVFDCYKNRFDAKKRLK